MGKYVNGEFVPENEFEREVNIGLKYFDRVAKDAYRVLLKENLEAVDRVGSIATGIPAESGEPSVADVFFATAGGAMSPMGAGTKVPVLQTSMWFSARSSIAAEH